LLAVGLTGGIGSGKSEVAKRLASLGAVVVDSDVVAREVVEPGTPGLAQVADEFGDDVLRPDGSLDRDRLADRVFDDDDARQRLNKIVHPLVGHEVMTRMAAAAERDPDAVVVNDVPLLVEAGLQDRYDVVVVVDVSPETQLDRLVRLRGMTEAAAQARINAQASREERLAAATYVIDNDGPLDRLDRQVRDLWRDLSGRARGEKGRES